MEIYEVKKKPFRYVYKHHLNDAGWFLKADDESFHLRYYLYSYSINVPIYLAGRLMIHMAQISRN